MHNIIIILLMQKHINRITFINIMTRKLKQTYEYKTTDLFIQLQLVEIIWQLNSWQPQAC